MPVSRLVGDAVLTSSMDDRFGGPAAGSWSRDALAQLVCRAMPLGDRLQRGRTRTSVTAVSPASRERLDGWCRIVADGDWETFEKRLAWDALDLDTALQALDPCSMQDGEPLPGWATFVD